MTARCLHQLFLDAAATHPDRPALEVDGQVWSYTQLRERAQAVAATLVAHRDPEGPPLTAVLGQRSEPGFAGILGALLSGHGYVPMLPSFPSARTADMLARSQARTLVVDAQGIAVLPDVLPHVPQPLAVLCLHDEPTEALRAQASAHTLLGPSDLRPAEQWAEPTVGEDEIAYLLFTSGSTGRPKGVMVAHRNIARFVHVVTTRYWLMHTDRFSHLFDVTFDLSLFDLFGPWSVGGCLCCPTGPQRMFPAQYVQDSKLTVWFSVPSTALLMKETQALVPDSFPGLRLSLFCGEALTVPVVEAFAAAAPRAVVENLYGPTELTLACSAYRWAPGSAAQAEGGVVPIGTPFSGMTALVVDDKLAPVEPGQSGELLMTGPQLALGYWNDEPKTQAAFVVPPGQTETFYRTGDLVRRPAAEDQPLLFLGRLDSQIKLRGYRVELGEIEAVLREESGLDVAVALGWPPAASGGAEGVVAFIDDADVEIDALLDRVAQRLPRYMVPREVKVVDSFPLNVNGKIDRKALRALLE